MSSNNRIIGALLVGAAAGAVLGILFAPEKGTETRRKIADGANDLVRNANDLVSDLQAKIQEGKGMISDLTDKIVSSSEQTINRAKDEFSNAANRNKQPVNENI